MFFLDLKRADVAIESGRLDDALQLLQASEQKGHRDGQRLIDRLTLAFVDRAKLHLNEGRLNNARTDCRKAAQLSGQTTDVAELGRKISAVEHDQRNQQRRHDDVMAMARQQCRAGAYTIGQKLLNGLSESPPGGAADAAQLQQSIETRRAIVDDYAAKICDAIEAGSFQTAIEIVNSLPPDLRSHSQITQLTERAVEPLAEIALKEFCSGRPDRSMVIGDLLRPHQGTSTAAGEILQCLSRCRVVYEQLRADQYADALVQLAVLGRMADSASWIGEVTSAVEQILQQRNVINESPLGLLNVHTAEQGRPVLPEPEPGRPLLGPFSAAGPGESSRAILQVDGVGSLLVLTGDFVTIGASTSMASSSLDVALQTEGTGGSIRIRRDGEDYFAAAESPFDVNGQRVTRKLLISGDSIAVGARGRLKFLQPVAASSSAVLQITGSRLPRRDVRHVVLLSDSLLFGAANSHFRVHDAERPVVFYRTDEGYALREAVVRSATRQDPLAVQSAAVPLPTGGSAEIGNVRFHLTNV